MSVSIKLCRVLGKINSKDFKVFERFLDDYSMRSKYKLLQEKIVSKNVIQLAFDGSVDDETIEECVHEFLACHVLVHTHSIKTLPFCANAKPVVAV